MSLPTYMVALNAGAQFLIVNSLVAPLPFKLRKRYLKFLMTSPFIARALYFLKIMQIFVVLLFIDAFRTAYIITMKPESEKMNSGLDGGDIAMSASAGLAARKLLAERNMNMTGSSLFLSYLLWRVYELNMDTVRYGERVAKSEGEDTGPPIDTHQAVFKKNYDSTKPDHEAATRKRNIFNQEAPVPDHAESLEAEKGMSTASS